MDNARIHHAKLVKTYMLTTNSEILYNVPYCPEYNPIEMIFSKVKRIIKKRNNSDIVSLNRNINSSFKKITSQDLVNCYKHSFASF